MVAKGAEYGNEKSRTLPEGSGRNPREYGAGAPYATARREPCCPVPMRLMEAVVERENMRMAYRRVMRNKGAPGVDGMTLESLLPHLNSKWADIKEELLNGKYQPSGIRCVDIPKPGGGGVRTLGIPTVLDRLIQQAVHQILSPIFEAGFSDSSYGFRPGRSAHQAVLKARAYVESGRRWVVDIDLEKFFDRVNHDVLMSRVARQIKDRRILGLIRRYLQAGIMLGGLVSGRQEGTPQGGPLSPLLSNILLDDLDKELGRRGHSFCRYADDANIYVRSRRAGERVMFSVSQFLEKRLRLKVNLDKSAVARPWERKFLGYSMTNNKKPRLKVAKSSVKRLQAKVRDECRRGRGRALIRWIPEKLTPLLRGWVNYFCLAEVKNVFEELDCWLRRRMRAIIWRQKKRIFARAKMLIKQGIDEKRAWKSAFNGRGPWWNSGSSHMNEAFPKKFFDSLGLVSLLDSALRFQCRS